MKRVLIATLGSLLLISACGGDDSGDDADRSRADLAAAEKERDDVIEKLDEAEKERDEFSEKLEEAEAARDEAESERAEAEAASETAEHERDELQAERNEALSERDKAVAEAEALRTKYDPQIRAELQGQVDAEIERACGAAVADLDASIDGLVEYDKAWKPVASRAAVVQAVTACAAPERAKSAEERRNEFLASCQQIDRGQIEKNPSAYEGLCIVVYAHIVQYDAATGPCNFHAELSSFGSQDWFDYKVRSTFGLHDDELLSVLETDCPLLDGIDNRDFVQVWATGLGDYTYDTQVGGSTTVPSFQIEQVVLVAKGD